MGIELRYVDNEGKHWALPDASGVTISPVLCDEGAVEFSLGRDATNFDKIKDLDEFPVVVVVNGQRRPELDGYMVDVDGDEAADSTVWKFTGYMGNGLLNDAETRPAGWPNAIDPKEPVLRFTLATPGTIVGTLMLQAQARGTLTDVTYGSFSATHDSNGMPWTQSLSIEYKPGVKYLEVLRNLYAQGLIEFQMMGKDLRLYIADSMTVDHTLNTPPLVFRRGQLTDSPRKRSTRNLANAFMAGGDEGLYVEAIDQASIDARRRREGSVSNGGVSDKGTLLALAQLGVDQVSQPKMEKTHGLTLEPGSPLPIVHFAVGDWAYSDTTQKLERLRIKQWTMSQDDDGVLSGSVSLNDLFSERTALLAKRVDGIIGGSTITGGSKAVNEVPDEAIDGKPPATPISLALSSDAYTDGSGTTLAQVSASWAQVTTNADGTIINDLRGYQVRWNPDPNAVPDPVTDGSVSEDRWQQLIREGWSGRDTQGPVPLKTQAAQAILDQLNAGLDVYEDLSFRGIDSNTAAYNEQLADEFYAATPGADWPGDRDKAKRWLKAYVDSHTPRPTTLFHPLYAGNTWRYVPEVIEPRVSWSPMQPGVPIYAQVRAIDKASNVSGWSSTVGIMTAVDTEPPPPPSAPSVENYMGLLRIAWDGDFAADFGNAGTKPVDFAATDVHLSDVADFVPSEATLLGSMRVAAVQFYDPAEYGQTYYVKLVARDYAGNYSQPSGQGSGSARPVVKTDVNGNVTETSFIRYRDDGNLIEDGSFALDWLNDPRTADTWWAIIAGDGATSQAVRRSASASVGSPVITLLSNSPVTPATTIYGRLRYKAVGANGQAFLRFVWTMKDGTITSVTGTSPLSTSQTTWAYNDAKYTTVPADARFLTVELAVSGDHTTGSWDVDDVEVRKVMGTALIEDAAISRAKIGLLAVGSAQIEELNVGKLVSGTGTFELVLAGRITTALTGQRTEQNSLGFYGWDANENLTLKLDGVDNVITGTLNTAVSGRRVIVGNQTQTTGRVAFVAPDGRYGRIRGFTQSSGLEAMRFEIYNGSTLSSWINLNTEDYLSYVGTVHEFQVANGPTPSGAKGFRIFMDGALRFSIDTGLVKLASYANIGNIEVPPIGGGDLSPLLRFTNASGGSIALRGATNSTSQTIDVVSGDGSVWYSMRASQFLVQSDAEAKSEYSPVRTAEALESVLAMPVRRYRRRNAGDYGYDLQEREEVGFIAQELPADVVLEGEDTQFVNLYEVVARLAGAVQALNRQIQEMRA